MSGNKPSVIVENNLLAEDLDHILLQIRDIIEEFRNARIFVTGGTGFFGTWLLETLAWANIKLNLNVNAVILSRDPIKFGKKAPHLYHHDQFKFLPGDVRDFKFPEGPFSHLFHFATDTSASLNHDNPLEMLDVIVEGMRHALDFAAVEGIKKVLLTSSGAVYGKQPEEISHISETYNGAPDVISPVSSYGEGKRVAELLSTIYSLNNHIEIKIARCFAFVGPYLPIDQHFAIGNFIKNALNNEPISIHGDGTPFRSYLYSSDLIIWLMIILSTGRSCYPYNVGSDDAISIKQLAEIICKTLDPSLEIKILNEPVIGKFPEQYVPSTLRARTELNLKQTVSLTEAVSKTYNYYKTKRYLV